MLVTLVPHSPVLSSFHLSVSQCRAVPTPSGLHHPGIACHRPFGLRIAFPHSSLYFPIYTLKCIVGLFGVFFHSYIFVALALNACLVGRSYSLWFLWNACFSQANRTLSRANGMMRCFNTIQYNTMQCNTVHYNAIQPESGPNRITQN